MRSAVHGRDGYLQVASIYSSGQEGSELTLCRNIRKLSGYRPGGIIIAHFHSHLFRPVIPLFTCLASESLDMGCFLQVNNNPVRWLRMLSTPVGTPESIQIAIQTSFFQSAVSPIALFGSSDEALNASHPVRSSNSMLLASIEPLKMK